MEQDFLSLKVMFNYALCYIQKEDVYMKKQNKIYMPREVIREIHSHHQDKYPPFINEYYYYLKRSRSSLK